MLDKSKPPHYHPGLPDKAVRDDLADAEKQIAYYTAWRDEAIKELERREKEKAKKR